MRNTTTKLLITIFLLATSSAAFAHTGHDVTSLAAGLTHPFSGLDHLLAMLAVGLWAARNSKCNGSGGRRVWLLPATFMTMLAAGAGIAMQWRYLPLVEPGIAASVLALGLLIALSLRIPVLPSVAVAALFGLMHGYAHGLELPESAAPSAYALGFLAATATLHLTGVTAGILTRTRFVFLAIHSDINLLRDSWAVSGSARDPHILCVCSGRCALSSPTHKPLATISVAVYRSLGIAIAASGAWMLATV